MTDLMNTSQHYPPNPNEIVGNRRPARPSSASQRSTTPTRNRAQPNLNTTAKLEQSIVRQENSKLNAKGKNRLYSTWTPLQDDETNAQLYEERRQLVNKWFEKWSDEQRRIILEDLFAQSRPRQLTYARNLLTKKFPSYHQDFTRLFPRVLCLYIFSFLDPRSLSRCAQVCWYWKFLSESDQIWMPKCLRFGWTPKHSTSPYETNIWKRVYTMNIQALQTMPIREFSHRAPSVATYDEQNTARSTTLRHVPHSPTSSKPMEHPPWRANSRNPSDTLRYNYLDNDDTVLESLIAKHRKQTIASPSTKDRTRQSRTEESTGGKRRSQSLSARGSPSVSFRDEHQSNHSFFNRTPVQHHRPVDIPRPPSSAASKSKVLIKTSNHDVSNRTWHATNNYLEE